MSEVVSEGVLLSFVRLTRQAAACVCICVRMCMCVESRGLVGSYRVEEKPCMMVIVIGGDVMMVVMVVM